MSSYFTVVLVNGQRAVDSLNNGRPESGLPEAPEAFSQRADLVRRWGIPGFTRSEAGAMVRNADRNRTRARCRYRRG